mgnify:FL=1
MMKVKRNYKTVLKLFLVCCIVTAAFSNFAVFAEDAADAYTFGVYHVYNSDGTEALTPAEIKAGQLKISYEFVKIAAKDKDRSVKLYAAVYGTNDELLYADSEYVSVIEKFCAFDLDGITVSEGDLAKIKSLKVFVWEKDGMKPVIEPYALGTAYVDTMKATDPTGKRWTDNAWEHSDKYTAQRADWSDNMDPITESAEVIKKYPETFYLKSPWTPGYMYYGISWGAQNKPKYIEIAGVAKDHDATVPNKFDNMIIRYKLYGSDTVTTLKAGTDYQIINGTDSPNQFFECKVRITCELPENIEQISVGLHNNSSWNSQMKGWTRIARVTIY